MSVTTVDVQHGQTDGMVAAADLLRLAAEYVWKPSWFARPVSSSVKAWRLTCMWSSAFSRASVAWAASERSRSRLSFEKWTAVRPTDIRPWGPKPGSIAPIATDATLSSPARESPYPVTAQREALGVDQVTLDTRQVTDTAFSASSSSDRKRAVGRPQLPCTASTEVFSATSSSPGAAEIRRERPTNPPNWVTLSLFRRSRGRAEPGVCVVAWSA